MPSAQRGHRLTDMEFDEVSLVTRPANQKSTVVLFKSEEAGMPDQTETKDHQQVIEDVRKNGLLEDQVVEYIEALEKANEELIEALDADDEVDDDEDLLKSADPRLVELVKSAEKRAVTAETIAKAEREQRRTREFIAKAEELPSLPGEVTETAELLKSAADHLDAETFDQLVDLLQKVNSMIDAGGVLNEVGKSTTGEVTSAYDAIEKAAHKIQADNPAMTFEQAVSQAVDENPDLYADHRKEA